MINKHLSICYAKQGKYKQVYEALRKIVYSTEDIKVMSDFAFCCNTLGKFDESICVLEKCLKINMKETLSWGLLEIAYNEKGVELVKNNRLPQAENMFRNSLSINNMFLIARTNLKALDKILYPRKIRHF